MKQSILIIICIILFLLTACTNSSQDEINEQDNISVETKTEDIIQVEQDFINIEFVDNQRFEFANGHFLHDTIIEEIMYHALGEYGEYFFAPGEWEHEEMMRLIAISEDGTKFAKDWLVYDGDKRVRFVFGNVRHTSQTNPDSFLQRMPVIACAFIPGEVFINNIPEDILPGTIVHEAAHAVLRLQERMSNFPSVPGIHSMYLEEGLCTVIEYLFFLESDRHYDTWKSAYDDYLAENYVHNKALQNFQVLNNFEDEMRFGTIYPQLMSHYTAASFIYYLFEHKENTREDFMRIFDDIYLFEEVYGVGMDDMIAEWLEYLEQYK